MPRRILLSEPINVPQPPPPRKKELALDERNLFFLACREAFRDGPVSEPENALLQHLQGYLEMSPEKAKVFAMAAMQDLQRRPREPKGPLTVEKLYGTAVKLAWKKGICSPQEQELLDGIADLYGISQEMQLGIQEHVLGDEAASQILSKSTILPPKSGVSGRDQVKEMLQRAAAAQEGGDALGATVADIPLEDSQEQPVQAGVEEEQPEEPDEGIQKIFSQPIAPEVETWAQRKKRSVAFKADELDFDEDFAWDQTYKGPPWKAGVVLGAGVVWTLVLLLHRAYAIVYLPVATLFLGAGAQMLRGGKLPKLGEKPRNPWLPAALLGGCGILLLGFLALASTHTTYDVARDWRQTMDRSRSAAESGTWPVAIEQARGALELARQAPTEAGRSTATGASWHNLGRSLWGEIREAPPDSVDPVEKLGRMKEVREAYDQALASLEPVKDAQESLYSIVVRDYARFLEEVGLDDQAEEIRAKDPY